MTQQWNKANPLKTLQGARDYIRTHTFRGTQINVVFEEGIYRFNESVEFDRNDSGNENLKIKYTAEKTVQKCCVFRREKNTCRTFEESY